VDPRRRRELAHYGAPIAFLAAATIAVLLIKAGLGSGSKNTTTAAVTRTPTVATSTRSRTTTQTATTTARYYTIQSGDTLGSVAIKENTTVADLLRLNPGIDPQALHVGQRIRVG
jgi:LysM repeat protein